MKMYQVRTNNQELGADTLPGFPFALAMAKALWKVWHEPVQLYVGEYDETLKTFSIKHLIREWK